MLGITLSAILLPGGSVKNRLLVSACAALTLVAIGSGEANADLMQLKWTVEGYYRTRGVFVTNLAREDRQVIPNANNGEDMIIPEIKRTSYMTHRLRLAPKLAFGNVASLNFQIDGLNDVLWGDNNGVATAPLFATDASNQNFLGGPSDPQGYVKLNKAWVEFALPIGKMRVGRMPSHWGLGLLANGGGNFNLDPDPERPKGVPQRKHLDSFFNDDFGDNHFGSTVDRVLFLTKPLSIVKGIMGKKDKSSKLVIGYAYDKLAESPFLPAEGFERTFRPFGQQGFISRGKNDDVNEHVVFAVWNDPYWAPDGMFSRFTDELRVGGYGVLRKSREGSTQPSELDPNETCGLFEDELVPCVDTGSKVFILDFWYRLRYGPFYSEAEVLHIGGTTFGGIPFPAKNEKKRANINGGVFRLGYYGTDAGEADLFDATIELGHASGDDSLEDEEFKQRALHPDFNVGLILFEEILREYSARTYGPLFISPENPEGAKGLFSNGGVINSNYINLRGGYIIPGLGARVHGGLLMAWVETQAPTGAALFRTTDEGSYMGTEVDLGVKASFAGKMEFSLETGYLRFGSALRSQFPNANQAFTLQSRLAFVF